MSFIKESKNAYKQVQENHIAIAMGNMLDDEGSMILNQLEELERAIEMIRTYVGTDYEKQLPAWVQAKVTLASDYISTVGNYLSSKNEKVTEETIKEEVDLEETSLSSIHKMKEDGKTSEEIAKKLKLNAGLVKKILGEEVELKEFTDLQIAQLKKEFDPLKGKQISTARANQLSNILNKLDDGSLDKLKNALIPFVSALAAVKTTQRKMRGVKITNIKVPGLENMAEKNEEVELKPVPSLEDSAKKHNIDIEVLKKQLEKGIEIEKEHTKDEKVAEKIALAHIDERPDYYIQIDKLEKKPVEKVEEACWTGYKQVGLKKKGKKTVPNCVPEETIREQKRLYIESIAAVKNKAEKSGMPYSILKQVYDRGMAAWKGGHRPGATQVQWALARVNSFVTKSSGTWGGADNDLAKKVKG
jgi:hypothetical protein